MTLTYGPNLGLMVDAATGESHANPLRAFLRGVDGLTQCTVKQVGLNTPPASPADGDCYVVGTAPTGAWASQGNKFTRYSTVAVAWEFFTPKQGWAVYDQATSTGSRYTGSSWTNAVGVGATLGAATASAAYAAAEQAMLQDVYDKMVLMETKLKALGILAS